jgi:hypothetical protein
VQGIADRGSHLWSESFAHGFLGLAMMIPAFFLILLVGWVLENILIEEADKRTLRLASPVGQRRVGATRVQPIPRRVEPVGRVNPTTATPTRSSPAKSEIPVTSPRPVVAPQNSGPSAAAKVTLAPGASPATAPKRVAAAPSSRPRQISPPATKGAQFPRPKEKP